MYAYTYEYRHVLKGFPKTERQKYCFRSIKKHYSTRPHSLSIPTSTVSFVMSCWRQPSLHIIFVLNLIPLVGKYCFVSFCLVLFHFNLFCLHWPCKYKQFFFSFFYYCCFYFLIVFHTHVFYAYVCALVYVCLYHMFKLYFRFFDVFFFFSSFLLLKISLEIEEIYSKQQKQNINQVQIFFGCLEFGSLACSLSHSPSLFILYICICMH